MPGSERNPQRLLKDVRSSLLSSSAFFTPLFKCVLHSSLQVPSSLLSSPRPAGPWWILGHVRGAVDTRACEGSRRDHTGGVNRTGTAQFMPQPDVCTGPGRWQFLPCRLRAGQQRRPVLSGLQSTGRVVLAAGRHDTRKDKGGLRKEGSCVASQLQSSHTHHTQQQRHKLQ